MIGGENRADPSKVESLEVSDALNQQGTFILIEQNIWRTHVTYECHNVGFFIKQLNTSNEHNNYIMMNTSFISMKCSRHL